MAETNLSFLSSSLGGSCGCVLFSKQAPDKLNRTYGDRLWCDGTIRALYCQPTR